MVDAEEREGAVEGVGPTGAGEIKGVVEVFFEEAVDDIVSGGVKIAGDESGDVGVGGFLLEGGDGVGEFDLAEVSIFGVFLPAFAGEETEVGGGGAEVEIEKDDGTAVVEFGGEELAAIFGHGEFVGKSAPDGDGTLFSDVVAIVAFAIEESFDEVFEEVGLGDFLEEEDIGLEGGEGFGGVDESGAVLGNDPDDGGVKVGGGRGDGEGSFGKSGKRAGFVGEKKEGESPEGGEDEGESGAVEDEGGDGEAEADESPNPDRENGDGGEAGGEAGVEGDRGEVDDEREREESEGDGWPWAGVDHGRGRGFVLGNEAAFEDFEGLGDEGVGWGGGFGGRFFIRFLFGFGGFGGGGFGRGGGSGFAGVLGSIGDELVDGGGG